MLVVIRHDPDADSLSVLVRLLQRAVKNVPAIRSSLRLELRPEPAQVCDARRREVDRCRRVGRVRLRTDLRPAHALVDGLTAEAVERLDPHAWIDEQIV